MKHLKKRRHALPKAAVLMICAPIVFFGAIAVSTCTWTLGSSSGLTIPTMSTLDATTVPSRSIDADTLHTIGSDDTVTKTSLDVEITDTCLCGEPSEDDLEIEQTAEDEYTNQYETYNYSEESLLLAKLIYLESGECSSDCQWLVGSTALNLADENGGLSSVAYNYDMFNVAYSIDSCTPSLESIHVAEQLISGDRDYQVKAFKTDSYHTWATPYVEIDNVYFSID